jgi:hypothetical protein
MTENITNSPAADPALHRWLRSRVAMILLCFGVVYAASLSFVYVEGDDASTIAYHALGRHQGLQQRYSPYHGMIDVVLRVVPANEPVLRVTMFLLTALAAVAFVVLMLRVVNEWLPNSRRSADGLVALVVLLAIPEVFYLGLIYTPTLMGMCGVLAAHLLLNRAVKSGWSQAIRSHPIALASSIVLFGVGVSCRWDVASYAMIIGTDLATRSPDGRSLRIELKSLLFSVGWTTAAAASSLAAIAATGYGFRQFLQALQLAGDELTQAHSWFSTVGSFQTLLTPALVFLDIVGFVALLRRDRRLALIVVLGVLPVLPYTLTREPKMLLPAWPVMVLCAVAGFEKIQSLGRARTIARAVLGLMLAAPWVVGVSVDSPDTAWGPGFDVRAVAPVGAHDSNSALLTGVVSRHQTSLRGFGLTVRGGLAIPTPEGPRPLGGHAAVLLGGGWRSLAFKLAAERREVIKTAIDSDTPILQDNRNAYLLDDLVRIGYTTMDPRDGSPELAFTERTFTRDGSPSVRIIYHVVRQPITHREQFELLSKASGVGRVIFFANYTSAFREWFEAAPDAVTSLGAFSAAIDLQKVRVARGW